MNEKFFQLPSEKQQTIINAAYKVFAENSYKKAPMSEIASTAGISKSLLFHYFINKRELYFYLWKYAMELTKKATTQYQVLETDDFFEMLLRTLRAKCSLMRKYPYIYAFSLNAYYEQTPEIKELIQANFQNASLASEQAVFEKIKVSDIRSDIDLHFMYREIIFATDGYMLNKYRSGNIIADEIEQEMTALIKHWKTVYSNGG